MSSNNPLPILHRKYGVNLSGLTAASKMHPSRDTLRRWISRTALPERVHSRFFNLTMTTWAIDPYKRKDLWQCYFDTPPHLYHLLWFVHGVDLFHWTGLTEVTVSGILRSPTLTRRQIRALGPRLMELINSLYKRNDPRAAQLERALRDRSLIAD